MKKLLFAIIATSAIAASAVDFRIEAESIGDKGSWRIGVGSANIADKQLSADHKAAENAPAVGVYNCPEDGRYYVWVRTFTVGEKYRKTEVKLNGKVIGKFGDEGSKRSTPEMTWKRTLGATQLAAGELKIEFKALSKYSRIDSLIFTTDQNFKPGDKAAVQEIPELDCEY